jgi:LysR family nitrogen assimilation transcriptional regulator
MVTVPPPSRISSGRTLAVGVPPLIAESLVVPLVRRFTRARPGALLRLHEAPSHQLLDWTLAGQVDLAIVFNVEASVAVRLETIATDDLMLIGAAGRPPMDATDAIPLDEVLALPLLMPRSGGGLHGMLEKAARQRGVRPDISFRVDGIAPILSLVRQGLGFTLLPFAAVATRVANGELRARPIVGPALPGVLSIASRAGRRFTPAMEQFSACTREEPALRRNDPVRCHPACVGE